MHLLKIRRDNLIALVYACLLLLPGLSVFADEAPALELAAPITDHAVLQRQMQVPVWGWSDAGVEVTVTFAGQAKTATASADGKWMVRLDPMEASFDPRPMTITAGGETSVELEGILVGEVWIASGQSNMQWEASACDVGRVLQQQIAERVEAGEEQAPIIREAKITDFYSALHPLEHATAEWSSEQGGFSAIAFAFAYELYRELGVPIGILNCSFSSTAIEAWTPREGFAAGEDEYTRGVYQRILETDPSTPEHRAAWGAYYRGIEQAIEANNDRLSNGRDAEPIDLSPPGNLRGNRDASWLYNARMHPMVPYAVRGAIWNQGYANSGGGITYYQNLHSMVRGWRMMWNNPELPVYFHQFYCAGGGGDLNHPSIDSVPEMRLGTWLARDIPNTGMASQIDIEGAIHYFRKTLPGQRLALHALRNQYGRDVVADGPMYAGYRVDGNRLIVEFDHARGGLVVATPDSSDSRGPLVIRPLEDGASQLQIFYIADADRVWHRADVQIDGQRVILTAPGVDEPHGVSYGTGGIGFQPNLYNSALLPATPFIYYDHELVTSATWPDEQLRIAGYEPDPNAAGLLYEYRKMPILAPQFRENAVLQRGVPVTIWGSAVHDWGYEADGEAVIHFSFGDIEQTIPVEPGMREWSVTLPAMEATTEPRTLRVALMIDGELAHERIAEGIVIGDVWYVAMPATDGGLELPAHDASRIVRVMQRQAKRDSFPRPSRFSVCVSTTPLNRFACRWEDAQADDLPGVVAYTIAARAGAGVPVGVIFMQNSAGRDEPNPPLAAWLPFEALADTPSLSEDYELLGAMYPGSPSYNANVRQHIADWQAYWADYIPQMIAERRVPDAQPWGQMPSANVSSRATDTTQVYNTMVHCFTPTAMRGAVFFTGPAMFEGVERDALREQLGALTRHWNSRFADAQRFVYTVPDTPYLLVREGDDPAEASNVAGRVFSFTTAQDSTRPVADQRFLEAVEAVAQDVYGRAR